MNRTATPLVASLAACLALAACGGGSSSGAGSSSTTTARAGTSSTASSPMTTTTVSTTTTGSSSTSTPGATVGEAVYFLRGEKLGAARRAVSAASPIRSALEALVAGPSAADRAAGLTSAIPAGTTLRGVAVSAGTATVDLSTAFGSGGGSLSMQERVAEVVFTATQFPTVQKVSFRVEGHAVTTLGGEGLVVSSPQTRADWESVSPAILVESPLPGDALTSPVVVRGTANTFEATFRIALIDPSGRTLVDRSVMATSGTGTRGTFSVSIPFSGATHGTGRVEAYELSAKDGSRINVVKIPVGF